jgi:hypothetical protein
MNKLLITAALLVVTGTAVAWQNNGSNSTGFNSSDSGGYTGPTGTNYQYNMNDIGDQIRYQSDSGAQIRDSIGGNSPGAQIDRNLGQPGGGIQW